MAAQVVKVGTAGGVPAAVHPTNEMLFVSSVTAPFLASARPMMFAPVFKVMLVSATRLPMNDVVVPSVAELPICQATPHGLPPLIKRTDDELAVVNVLPVLKMKVAAAFPCAFNVKVPVNPADDEKQ
jgi:hypothetical protein